MAGQELLHLRMTSSYAGAALRSEGDQRSHRLLVDALAGARPHDLVLSEEGWDDPARLDAERVWIIDPLDGTREYAERRDDWAVHVALWERGQLTAGAVARPATGLVAGTDSPPLPIFVPPHQPLRIAVSRSRAPAVARRLQEVLPSELVPMGSAGVKVLAVLTGEVDAYVHAGGQYEWDSAAPVAVAAAAGAVATRLDGSPLVYNRPDPSLPDLVVTRADHAVQLRSALDQALRERDA